MTNRITHSGNIALLWHRLATHRVYSSLVGVVVSALAGTALSAVAQESAPEIEIRRVFADLDLTRPVFLTHAGDGSNRIFIVEQPGRIQVFANEENPAADLFLDISSQVNSGPNEAGLLSMAFHPSYAENGRFFIYYTTGSLVSRLAEFAVSPGGNSANLASEQILLEVVQPAGNHNGGQLAFGPDGKLYVGLGDGGSSGDRFGNGQNRSTLLGSILRLDIDSAPGSYAIPHDNPFVGNDRGWREEIWAWGLRNPWRFSFDRLTGQLWTGDVGQNAWEEVDLIEPGQNYGWNRMEGFHCFSPASNCDSTGLALPVVEYGHAEGRSITGGYVYRGPQSFLQGVYLYGDFVSRRIWGLRYEHGEVVANEQLVIAPSGISSFGEDEKGEVYVLGLDGTLYVLEAPEPERPTVVSRLSTQVPFSFELSQNRPNPFNAQTTVSFSVPAAARSILEVFDLRGQRAMVALNQRLPPGRYELRLDFSGLASGTYFYRLRSGVDEKTLKLTLIK